VDPILYEAHLARRAASQKAAADRATAEKENTNLAQTQRS